MPDARAVILKNHLSPGDVLIMTAALHSLHKTNPGKFLTAVDTACNAIFENNPDVIPIEKARELGAQEVQTHYPLINESNQRAVHVMQGYCDFFAQEFQVPVPLITNRPQIYLSMPEHNWLPQVQQALGRPHRYWVICAGRKACFTAKFWGTENYQRVVDALRGRVLFVQVGKPEHHHPPLKNVLNLLGQTDDRQLVRLVHHSDGVLCGVTFLHHLAAALEKPSVTIMGGREPVQWNAYPKAHLLHTIGALPCCRDGGCWRSRTVALGDGAEQDGSLCVDPVIGDEPIPRCQLMIKPDEVVNKILLTTK